MKKADLLKKLLSKEVLSKAEAYELHKLILAGKLSKEGVLQIFQVYKKRQISADEFLGVVEAVQDSMLKINTKTKCIDTAGTGGDGLNTFNISSIVAIILAACGVPVAKHGNKSASGKCGSADVFEELGMKIEIKKEKAKKMLEKYNFAFLYAPLYHPAFKNVAEARKEFGQATYFNFIGPIANPVQPLYQLIGVTDKTYINVMGSALLKSGVKKVWFAYDAKNHLDEISPVSKTEIYEFEQGKPVNKFEIDPAEYNMQSGKIEDLRGGIKEINAAIFRNVLSKKSNDTQKNVVILNAAAGLVLYGKAKTFVTAIEKVKKVIASGEAIQKLEEIIKISNR